MIYNNKKILTDLLDIMFKKNYTYILFKHYNLWLYFFPEESSVSNVFPAPLRQCSPVVEKLTTSLLMTLIGPEYKDTVFYV